MNQINWKPGEEGKGVVSTDNSVHVFNDDDYKFHSDYVAQVLGSANDAIAYFYVEPDGDIELTYPNRSYDDPEWVDRMAKIICAADPHFHESGNKNLGFL